jgi:hypothetical protein
MKYNMQRGRSLRKLGANEEIINLTAVTGENIYPKDLPVDCI